MATVSEIGLFSDHRTMHLVAAELALLTTVPEIVLLFDERTVIFDDSLGDWTVFDHRTFPFWTRGLSLFDDSF